jgi:hypothetical protein
VVTTIEVTVLPVEQELVQDLLELVHRGSVHLDQEAVLAGDAVALGDLGQRLGELGDPGQMARCRADPGEAVTGSPSAAGSTSIRYPVITPARSRRCTRSVTAGALIFSVRASADMPILGSACNSVSSCTLTSSSSVLRPL